MGYLYLCAALAAGLSKGFLGKSISRDVKNFRECVFVNLLRMLFCAVVGFALAVFKAGTSGLALTADAFFVCLFAAVSMSVFCVCWMFAYRTEAYVFLNVFTMLGTVVTCILDFVVYKTEIGITEWIGIAVLLAAVYIMSVYNKGIKGKFTKKALLILVIGSLGSALSDFSQKMYMKNFGNTPEIFNFYMYALGGVLLAAVYLYCFLNRSAPGIRRELYDKRHVLICFGMAFFLYLNSVTKTMAAGLIPSAQLYPVLQGANLILSALMAHIMFKEKIKLKCICGMVTAFCGLMILNLL